jgi:hypothetical protein
VKMGVDDNVDAVHGDAESQDRRTTDGPMSMSTIPDRVEIKQDEDNLRNYGTLGPVPSTLNFKALSPWVVSRAIIAFQA